MGRMLGRNFVIELFLVHTLHETKFSKMTITLQRRPMGPYPFGCFLVSPGPTYGRNIKSKAVNHFGRFPRKLKPKDAPVILIKEKIKKVKEKIRR